MAPCTHFALLGASHQQVVSALLHGCADVTVLVLSLLLLGERLLNFGGCHGDLDSIGLLFEHGGRDDDRTRSHVEKPAELGPHGGLAGGCPHVRYLAQLLAIGAINRQTYDLRLDLCRRRLRLLRERRRRGKSSGNDYGCHT